MNTTLDGQSLFDEQGLRIEPGSLGRDSIERAIAGLDGVLSIDMGGRSRKVRQTGVLRAQSHSQMDERVSLICSFIDGSTHKLVTNQGEEFDDIRMDVFKVNSEHVNGNGVGCYYEIIYTQLVTR